MKNVKRFEIDVPVSINGEEWDGEDYPLQIEDLEIGYADANDGTFIAEAKVYGNDGHLKFQLTLTAVEAVIEILTHIKAKVLATKKVEEKSNEI